jgi:phosphopantetheinyl transferase
MMEYVPHTTNGITVSLWLLQFKQLLPYYHHLYGVLSKDEQLRAARFKVPAPRESFVLTRACLRLILAEQLQQLPTALSIKQAAHGKPWCAACCFNVAHSHDYAIIASSHNTAVGVDIEYINPAFDLWTVATYFTDEEQQHLLQLPADEQRVQFFRYWTKKEAWAKLDGGRALQNWVAMHVPDSVQHHEMIVESHMVQCMAEQPCHFTLKNIQTLAMMKEWSDE